MIRLAIWFLGVLALAAVGAWLADHPGAVTVQFQAYEIDTSFAALALMFVVVAATSAAVVWLVGWLRRDMPVFGSNQVIKRQRRGFKMLNQSLVALSAGDPKLARTLVERAEVLLPPQPMVHLIAAEAATRSGDFVAASKRYSELEDTEDGRLLGLRGLLIEARRTGHENEALRLARVAFAENRKSPWVLKTLFTLEVSAGHWREAEAALDKVAKENLLEKPQIAQHRGALAYAEATEVKLTGDKDQARKILKKALNQRPDFAPATVALVRLELGDNNIRKATKIVSEAWAKSPHPALSTVFKELDVQESATDWLKRVRTLVKMSPDHPESKLLLVDAMMDAGEYDAVKPVLEALLKDTPSPAAWQYRLALAHVLKEDPDPIETALKHASGGAHWQCGECGHQPKSWSPLCSSCSTFDSLEWTMTTIVMKPNQLFSADNTIALLADSPAR